MRARLPIIVGVCLLAAAYIVYPFVTLYRLNSALADGDTRTLARLVDWPAVREGLQEDIADQVTDVTNPRAVTSGAELAPFGYSFTRGVARQALQQDVTPQRVIDGLRGGGGRIGLRLAYFDGWSEFMVRLAAGPDKPGIRLQMDLDKGVWRVARIWLPLRLLRQAESRPPVEMVRAQVPSD